MEVEEEIAEDMTNGDAHEEFSQRRSTRLSERIPEMDDLELEQMLPPASPRKKASKPRKDNSQEKSPAKKRKKQDKENREGSQTPRAKTPRAADSERFSQHFADNDLDSTGQRTGELGRDRSEQISRQDTQNFNFEDEEYDQDHYDQPMSVGPVSSLFNCLKMIVF